MNNLDGALLWRHETHEDGREYAQLGVAALVGTHHLPQSLFLDCMAIYVQSGLAATANAQLQDTKADARAKPEGLATQQLIYKSLVGENLTQIRRDPFIGIDLFVDTHLEPTIRGWENITQTHNRELEASIQKLSAIPALGNSQAATEAIHFWIGMNVHTPDTLSTFRGFENNPVIQALQAFALGDETARATSKAGRELATFMRRLAGVSNYRKTHAAGLSRSALQWAAVWETFHGRCLQAARSDLPLFEDLKRSKDVSLACAPFNKQFGVRFPRGRAQVVDVTLPRGHRVSPKNW